MGRADQVLGASVTLTGWAPGQEAAVAEALEAIMPTPFTLSADALPLVAIETSSPAEAERALDLLEAAGGTVSVARVSVARDVGGVSRPACPSCDSERTQPFTYAGPAARVNMKCTVCGTLFRARPVRP